MKKQVTYEAIDSLIISIRCCNMEQIKKYLQQYDSIIVNRLESQTRQPSLYFSAVLIDHQQSYQIMKLLIQRGANPRFKDSFQQTVLFYVCRDGKQRCLDLLLHQGLDLNDIDLYGQTPVYYASKENRLNIIKKIIDKGVDLNNKDLIAGQTPLFYAAKQGHLDMCKILVQNGCDVSIQDTSGKMASHLAKKHGHQQVFEYLNNEYQNMKDKKAGDQMQSIQNQQKPAPNRVVKKRKEPTTYQSSAVSNTPKTSTSTYRLYRADNLGNLNQVTYQQFEQLVTQYPELNQMMRKPQQIDMNQLQEVNAKDSWLRAASKVLTTCFKAKGGYYFHDPVDPAKYGIDDYFQIITEPMDFGTIRKKLNNNVYSNIEEFTRDMNLVFDNCVKYNGPENTIAKHSIQIRGIFQENMKQMGFMK